MPKTHQTFCRICEALCGLEVDVKRERVVAIRPNPAHVATDGFACVKGLNQHQLYDSPDRLLHPLHKTLTGHQRVTWREALDGIGGKVRQIIADSGPNSVAMYVGTAAGFGVLHPIFAQGFMTGIGSTSMYSSATQDCANKFAAATHMYGFPFTQPFPDIRRTNCLVILGANPVVSKWSFLQVPNPAKHLKAMEARGGKLFVIDPRRTESAKAAGEHVFIRPDTDVFLLLSFLRELAATGGLDRARVAEHMAGLDEVLALAEPWTPERTEAVTRVPAAKLKEIVAAYRQADGAAIYSSTGVNMGSNGVVAFWIQEVINAVSGNLDRRGGTLVGRGIFDLSTLGRKHGTLLRKTRSRIGNLPSVNDTFSGGILADEILTPGKGQIRALFVAGGNPLVTMANGGRLREAFSKLDLVVSLDILPGETAAVADYVLPCTSPLQRPDLPFLFPLLLGLQARPYLQATRAIIAPQGDQRDEATIFVDLANACGVNLFGSAVAQRALELARHWPQRVGSQWYRGLPQEAILSSILRLCGQGGFGRLLRERNGRLRPDHHGEDFLSRRVITPDSRVQLAPDVLLRRAERLGVDFERERAGADRLKLITKRAVTSHNSWTHNLPKFVAGKRATNYLYMHPDDAERLGLRAGSMVDVTSKVATVRLPLELLGDLMPGTVAMPHGWGHQSARGLSVASQTRGVNVNLLAADGVENTDPVSGMVHLTGLVVDVRRAAGEQSDEDWSGLPSPLSSVPRGS